MPRNSKTTKKTQNHPPPVSAEKEEEEEEDKSIQQDKAHNHTAFHDSARELEKMNPLLQARCKVGEPTSHRGERIWGSCYSKFHDVIVICSDSQKHGIQILDSVTLKLRKSFCHSRSSFNRFPVTFTPDHKFLIFAVTNGFHVVDASAKGKPEEWFFDNYSKQGGEVSSEKEKQERKNLERGDGECLILDSSTSSRCHVIEFDLSCKKKNKFFLAIGGSRQIRKFDFEQRKMVVNVEGGAGVTRDFISMVIVNNSPAAEGGGAKVLAVGTDCSHILIFRNSDKFELLHKIDGNEAHERFGLNAKNDFLSGSVWDMCNHKNKVIAVSDNARCVVLNVNVREKQQQQQQQLQTKKKKTATLGDGEGDEDDEEEEKIASEDVEVSYDKTFDRPGEPHYRFSSVTFNPSHDAVAISSGTEGHGEQYVFSVETGKMLWSVARHEASLSSSTTRLQQNVHRTYVFQSTYCDRPLPRGGGAGIVWADYRGSISLTKCPLSFHRWQSRRFVMFARARGKNFLSQALQEVYALHVLVIRFIPLDASAFVSSGKESPGDGLQYQLRRKEDEDQTPTDDEDDEDDEDYLKEMF